MLNCSFKQPPFLSFLAQLPLPAVPASTFLTYALAKLWYTPGTIISPKICCIFHAFFRLYPRKLCKAEISQIWNQGIDFQSSEFLTWSKYKNCLIPGLPSALSIFSGANSSTMEDRGIHELCLPVSLLLERQRWHCRTDCSYVHVWHQGLTICFYLLFDSDNGIYLLLQNTLRNPERVTEYHYFQLLT